MASGRSVKGSQSVTGGSDEVISHECDSCKYDGSRSKGIAFCGTCAEYLCGTCVSVHKKNKTSRGHNIAEGQDLHMVAKLVGSDSDEDYCDVHKDKEIKFYCETHDLVMCDVCKAIDHRQCDGMVSIQEAVKGKTWTAKAEGEIDQIRQLITDFIELKSQQNLEYSEFKKQGDKCRKEMHVLRDELNTSLDRLEQDMHAKLKKADRENTSSLIHIQTVADDSIHSLEKAVSSVESVRKTDDDKKVFIAMKKARRRTLSAVVTNLSSESVKVPIKFEADPSLLNIIKNLQQLGQLTITIQTGNRVVLKDKKAMKIGEFSVRESSDTKQCYIAGGQFLEDGRLVGIDCINKKVKILNSNLTLQSSLTLQRQPFDLSLIDQQEAVVTIPSISKLQFMKLSPRLELIRQVTTRFQCWGVVCHNSKLYGSCEVDKILAVMVMNLLGHLETMIGTHVGCTYPGCIAADTRGYLYISNDVKHMVVCMTLKGTIVYLYTYTCRTQHEPMSLLLDTDNNVLVCGIDSNNVQVISDKGTYHSDFILTGEGGVGCPASLAYRRSDNTLVVGMLNKDMMLSFRLE